MRAGWRTRRHSRHRGGLPPPLPRKPGPVRSGRTTRSATPSRWRATTIDTDPRRPRRPLRIADLRGLVRLGTEATLGVLDVVEHLHRSVLDTVALRLRPSGVRTRGLTGAIYRSIGALTRGVGHALDHGLRPLQRRDPDDPERSRAIPLDLLSALNGVLGDRLEADGNPLAIDMHFRCEGARLPAVGMPCRQASAHLLLSVHGLCMNERQWQGVRDGRHFDHPGALAAALGGTRVDLRYNSGLAIADNGHRLALALQDLCDRWPCRIERLSVIAHSMGGLVIRSACAQASQLDLGWPGVVREIVFLGTPHQGAPLERGGQWLHRLLGRGRFSAPFARLARLRSAGITDLRHGSVLADPASDRFEAGPSARRPLPLPAHIAHYAIAASLGRSHRGGAGWLGDGLVPVASALGEHADPAFALDFGAGHCWIAPHTGHIELLSSPAVCRQLFAWLAPG